MRREMLSVAAAVAVLAGAARASAPETEFSALIRAPNMQSVAGGAGVAAFKGDDRSIHFSVDIGGIITPPTT